MVTTDLETEITYTGIPASPGIAFGPIHVIARGFSAPEVYAIPEEDIAEEQERFTNAVDGTKKQLIDLQERLESLSGNKESEIFDAIGRHLGVEYRYADTSQPHVLEVGPELTGEMLSELPPEWIAELRHATLVLDRAAMAATAG